MVVECQDERSQLENRAKALRVLKARLLDQAQQKADAAARLLSGSFLLMLEERTDRLSLAKCA